MQLQELFDRAKAETGSDTATAKKLGVSQSRLSDWRHGRIPCPISAQVDLCGIAGLSEAEAMLHVWEVAREKSGKYLRAGAFGAVALIAFMAAGSAPRAVLAGEPNA